MNARIAGFLIFLFALAVGGFHFWLTWTSDIGRVAEATSPATDAFPVQLRAWVPEQPIRPGTTFLIDYEIRNSGAKPVLDIVLEPEAHARWQVDWWEEPGETFCWWGRTSPPAGLEPSAARRARAHARIGSGQEPASMLTAFRFVREPKAAPAQGYASLGPVMLEGDWDSARKAAKELLNAMALPFLLGALAWFLPYAAERNSHELQTWNLLLPQSMEHATKYYLPVCSSIQKLARLRAEQPANHREALYAVLMLLRHMKALRENVGGLHFKNRRGEEAAAQWWVAVKFMTDKAFDTVERERALDAISTTESYSRFEERFQNWQTKARFVNLEADFQRWIAGPHKGLPKLDDCLPAFSMLRAILKHEANRPLEYWFRAPEDKDYIRETAKAVYGVPAGVNGWAAAAQTTRSYVRRHL